MCFYLSARNDFDNYKIDDKGILLNLKSIDFLEYLHKFI